MRKVDNGLKMWIKSIQFRLVATQYYKKLLLHIRRLQAKDIPRLQNFAEEASDPCTVSGGMDRHNSWRRRLWVPPRSAVHSSSTYTCQNRVIQRQFQLGCALDKFPPGENLKLQTFFIRNDSANFILQKYHRKMKKTVLSININLYIQAKCFSYLGRASPAKDKYSSIALKKCEVYLGNLLKIGNVDIQRCIS